MKKWHIVYPYRIPADGYFGWELKYSIRSLYKNFKEDFDITVIGDIPDWINREEVTCIELDNHDLKIQRQSKINQKILKACDLYDDFLLFNDDIYIMSEITGEELSIPRYLPKEVTFRNRNFEETNSFVSQIKNSYFKLKEIGRQHFRNFVTHTPHFYETEKIKEIQKRIDLAPNEYPSVVFEYVYHNFFGAQGEPVDGFRYGCWGSNCERPNEEKLINHDEKGIGKNPWLKDHILGNFKEKCEAEL